MQQSSSRAPSPSPPTSNHHVRSNSQPIIAQEQYQRMLHLHLQQTQQSHQGLQFNDISIESEWDPESSFPISHQYFPSSQQQQQLDYQTSQHQNYNSHTYRSHTFDMCRFLDFTVEASVLLETLHQNGLIHGQLSPTSFRWEKSSSLKTVESTNATITSPPTSSSSSTSTVKQDSDQLSSPPKHNHLTHPTRRENHTSPSQLTLDKSGSLAKNNSSSPSPSPSHSNNSNNAKSVRKQRRYSLVLDCTHLGLGEKSTESADSPARKGLRDHSQPSSGQSSSSASNSGSSTATTVTTDTTSNNSNNSTANTGFLTDPTLFSPSDPNLQPYNNTSSATIIHDAFATRMARIKRTLLPLSSSSSTTQPNACSPSLLTSSPLSSGVASSGSAIPGSPQPLVIKQHFLLHVPQELHSPPGCTLPVQIDIYSLGAMFYYLWASYTTFLLEDLSPGAIAEGLNSITSGHGSGSTIKGACLPITSTRLANVIHKMVAKSSRDRFLSMTQVRKELTSIRDQAQEAQNKEEAELKLLPKGVPDIQMDVASSAVKSNQTVSTPSSLPSSTVVRPSSPANSTHSLKSTSTHSSQELDSGSSLTHISGSSSFSHNGLSHEDRAFVLETVLSLAHISNLQELLRAISHALDNVLVGHPPEEMAIILWQKDEHQADGGTWAIMEDKYNPGTTQSTLTWTDLSERRDHMPVLVRKALNTKEPIFSTAVGSRSQLPTIACVPIMKSSSDETSTLVGAIYLHHLHPRFYFTKRDQEMLKLFCQKLVDPLLHCDKIARLEKQLSLATQRNRFLEDTIARIQKNEHEVFSWMEALPCFVWAAERDDVASRRYLSRSWFDFTGLPGDTRTSDRWISAMHPEDVAGFQKEVSQSYKTGVYKDCEFRLMRYDGVYRWHLSRAVPVLNHSGAILKWVGVSIDIDDLYRAQKAELHKKSNFLANMSHELRTPFSGFHGMLSLLGYSNLDEEQQECVFTAKASCEKLLLIIDDLLDFSKLEADKVTLEASPFDMEEVFEEVEDIVEPLASQKSLELAFIKGDNVPEILIGDCNRLKQILLNLVGNAIKFTHSGHVAVRCEVLDRDSDMVGTAGVIDDDKFYFKHEKNGGGQCQSELRPPNSGRFSSPEPLSENSIKLMFNVQDTGIGISTEEQEVLFSPFSQVDGSATRSYGGSGLGLSICLQLVKLMKGRIGLKSERDKGSTFWFMIQCERSNPAESPSKPLPEAEVGESTKEIKRITRTLGTPRILIASTSETTISTLQAYLSDFNTEVADLPSIAASRLEESVANGIRFDFVCWDFPKYDPHHETMLELQSRPNLNNVHFVLLYTPPNTDVIRRAQSLQHPPSSSASNSLSNGRKTNLSQSMSLRLENTGSTLHKLGNRSSVIEVPGLSPEKLNSLRITCISKPIRRLKLLRAFVEILDDSARIHGAQTIKKSVSSSSSGVAGGTISSVAPTSSLPGTGLNSPISSPTISSSSSATLSPASMARSPSVSMSASFDAVIGKEITPSLLLSKDSTIEKPDLVSVDSGASLLPSPQEQKIIVQNPPIADQLPVTETAVKTTDSTSSKPIEIVEIEITNIVERSITPEPIPTFMAPPHHTSIELTVKEEVKEEQYTIQTEENKEEPKGNEDDTPKPLLKQTPSGSGGKYGKLRSNSPKPVKTSKLVTEEATELSLSHEEAKRIAGMRILLAEDNVVAQKVLSKQLSLFGLVISCANDGADALTLFKSHPRGYYTLGFFDHHMPNCDGVQATQQIRALEKEHAAEVKGSVPRLPLVAVSADIQETARKACLNSGMERYVTKPLMQKDLVAMVRHYCVIGDAAASTLTYVPPPEGADVLSAEHPLGSSDSIIVASTVEAMVSAGHVSAPISSGLSPTSLLSVTSSPIQKSHSSSQKRELELSPAALRGLALIRETSMQDESSKVGGGGSAMSMSMALPTITSVAGLGLLSHPMQHSNSHLGHSGGPPMSPVSMINRVSSSSSLSGSYQAAITSSPIVMTSSTNSTPTPTVTSPPIANGTSALMTGLTNHSAHFPGPIAAMAAGAAAAVAVASAAVNTVSSAIHDHMHQPSISSAQFPNGVSGNVCSPWTNILGGGGVAGSINSSNNTDSTIDSQMLAQRQQQEQLQLQLQLQLQQQQYQQQMQQQQQQQFSSSQQQQPQESEPQHIYHPPQEVFVPYLHPCEPSPTLEPMQDTLMAGLALSASGSGASVETSNVSTMPMQLNREIDILQGLQERILEYSHMLIACSDLCAELDVLVSLAQVARLRNYRRPTLTEENVLHIVNGRHPLQELVVDSFVPNDTHLGEPEGSHSSAKADEANSTIASHLPNPGTECQSDETCPNNCVMILSGANSSGKSVYLKQVALITYMAHIGSFVPADSAVIGLTDKILTRLQTRETVSSIQSAFMTDLQQVIVALNMATKQSLIILDEFGKGTTSTDGAGIFCGVIEHFVNRIHDRPRVLATTHFHELFENQLLDLTLPISLYTMEIYHEQNSLEASFLFRVIPGTSPSSLGPACAAMAEMPMSIVQRGHYLSRLFQRYEVIVPMLTEHEKSMQKMYEQLTGMLLSLDLDRMLEEESTTVESKGICGETLDQQTDCITSSECHQKPESNSTNVMMVNIDTVNNTANAQDGNFSDGDHDCDDESSHNGNTGDRAISQLMKYAAKIAQKEQEASSEQEEDV
ncbi:histidine kinase osmosensor [Entomortierella lignicola]|nr:histidine kinase osmosensor [Entomortierella lignicola]